MAVAKADILDAIANMTVLELSELIKEMEEKFGVSAAAAAVAVAAPAALEVAWEAEVVQMGHVPPYGSEVYYNNVYIGNTGGGTPLPQGRAACGQGNCTFE